MAEQVICPQCGEAEPPSWRDQEMNPELHAYVRSYISPVKQFHLSLDDAADVWGTKIQPEDLLL